jgi:hypothetical protein
MRVQTRQSDRNRPNAASNSRSTALILNEFRDAGTGTHKFLYLAMVSFSHARSPGLATSLWEKWAEFADYS